MSEKLYMDRESIAHLAKLGAEAAGVPIAVQMSADTLELMAQARITRVHLKKITAGQICTYLRGSHAWINVTSDGTIVEFKCDGKRIKPPKLVSSSTLHDIARAEKRGQVDVWLDIVSKEEESDRG